ncbi:Amino acid ABC transporter, periplasmic amino acid-binding protein [Pseudorhizobium banfieldiae]|uniref:Amino acid ABC transporter, periplasmic amino acid-binding protein n=1 Tax=Pseudorhizobium banfieldiae TaxID=1125847 RepID=L0NHE5_9HYPH|nr:ABC transporter substrate-binding protein [Pseudorhizobium banfieldiae]CAD6615603.1 amino acid ABC transporter [arsenite-oxidising bacterium NT-25]CCF20294.1 Amino acid ABC transporter, periplasmic amino acid-binding protein [Pseudorhizobium banfieldiae]
MKKTLLTSTVFAMTAAFTSFAAAQDAEIRIATEGAYPPFNFTDTDGSLKGFDVDIANALCEEMKAKCAIVAQDWDGIIPGLMANKYDAIIASMSITEERKQQIDFTNKYYTTPLAVIAPKDGDVKGVSVEDLKDKVVGAQASTTQANYATDVYEKAGIEVKLYPTQEEAAADLQNGRIDALISDKFVVVDWLNGDGKDCCAMVGDVPGTETEAGIGIRKGEEELKERFNTAIDAIVANGTYGKIVAKYFPFDIY